MNIRRDELLERFRRRVTESKHALLHCPAVLELDVQPVRVSEITHEAIPGTRAHRLDADLDPACAPGGPLLETLRAEGEATVVHVPDRQRQRREALEVVPAKRRLTITEIHSLAQLRELGQRCEVGKDCALSIRR